MMERTLFGIEKVEISIDDVIVHTQSMQELISRQKRVFERLRKCNLKLNRSKCEFGLQEISVLGHVMSADGIKPDPKKTQAILETPSPRNIAELRSFLGTCGYMSKFIPDYANVVEPLRKLTRNENKWQWCEEQIKSFEALKILLSKEPVLACFSLNAPTFVVTDASPVGLGAILMQEQKDGERKPVAYISKTLTEVERRYSQIEREALAIVWAVERFHDYLYGISFTIVTDNKPLMSMLCPDSKKMSPPRIQRLFWRLLQYEYSFKYVDGKHNIADSMSRLPCKYDINTLVSDVCDEYVRFILHQGISELKAVTLEDIRRETASDEFLSKLSACVKSGKWSDFRKHKTVYNMQSELSLYEGVILREDRIFLLYSKNVF